MRPARGPAQPPLSGVPARTVIEPLAAEETNQGQLYGFEPMENSGLIVGHLGTVPKDRDREARASQALGTPGIFPKPHGAGEEQGGYVLVALVGGDEERRAPIFHGVAGVHAEVGE